MCDKVLGKVLVFSVVVCFLGTSVSPILNWSVLRDDADASTVKASLEMRVQLEDEVDGLSDSLFSKDQNNDMKNDGVGGVSQASYSDGLIGEGNSRGSGGGDSSYDWPMFRHDVYHTGCSTSKAPDTKNLLWWFKTRFPPNPFSQETQGKYMGFLKKQCGPRDSSLLVDYFFFSPAVANGKVYASPSSLITICWDEPYYHLERSLTVADGRVYATSINYYTLYCLNEDTGDLIWGYTVVDEEGHYHFVVSTPAVYDGKVYLSAGDSKIHCFNAETGDKLWDYKTGERLFSSPAVANGMLYVGSENGTIYCVDAENGSEIWRHQIGGWIRSSPAVAYRKVYVGSSNGGIYCLDAENGSRVWMYQTDDWIESSPVLHNGRLYASSKDQGLYCLNATTGEKMWERETMYQISYSPAVAYNRVYATSNGFVYCWDAETGEGLWSHKTDDSTLSSPTVADGKVYVAGWQGFYCLNAHTGFEKWSVKWSKLPDVGLDGFYCFADPVLVIKEVFGAIGGVNVEITNPGDYTALNITYNISLKGGFMGGVNVETINHLYKLDPQETIMVSSSKPVFGLGKINVKVTVDAENAGRVSKQFKGFIFGLLAVITGS